MLDVIWAAFPIALSIGLTVALIAWARQMINRSKRAVPSSQSRPPVAIWVMILLTLAACLFGVPLPILYGFGLPSPEAAVGSLPLTVGMMMAWVVWRAEVAAWNAAANRLDAR